MQFPEGQYHVIDIGENTPERDAQVGRKWREMGAQILGGWCGWTPEHIGALRLAVKGG